MQKIFCLMLGMILFQGSGWCQSVVIGTLTPGSSAVLDGQSTSNEPCYSG